MIRPFQILPLFLVPYILFAQVSEKELQKHRDRVAKSAKTKTVIVSLDTLYNAGVPYCLFKVAEKVLWTKDYSVQTLGGKELVYIKFGSVDDPSNPQYKIGYYVFNFMQSGNKAEIQGGESKIQKLIIDNNLAKAGDINPDGEKRMVMLYPPKFSQGTYNNPGYSQPTNNNSYATVERNRESYIFISGGEISQGQALIGRLTKRTSADADGIKNYMEFYLPNGVKVAIATKTGYDNNTWSVITLKDNKTSVVNASSTGRDADDIAKYLSDNYYF